VTEMHEAGPPPPGAPMEEPPPARELWPWLLVLLVLVLAGLAAAWFIKHDSKKAAATTVTVPVVTPSAPATRKVAVPALVGMKVPRALERLTRLGLQSTVRSVYSEKPKGTVSAQDPAAGKSVARASMVALRVSKGRPRVPVPDLVGQSREDAVQSLAALGLKPDVFEVPTAEPRDIVVAQHPGGGTQIADGDAVRLNISAGRPRPETTQSPLPPEVADDVTVPDVAGMRLEKARKKIRKEGLVTEIRLVPSDLPQDTVVSQSPRADTRGKPGDHVLVTVSSGGSQDGD
jgi:eukaryotic-like serine/threonine-protein kinase